MPDDADDLARRGAFLMGLAAGAMPLILVMLAAAFMLAIGDPACH